MAITVQCQCGKRFQVGDGSAGKRARCVGCGNTFVIPAAPDEAPVNRKPGRARGGDGKWSEAAVWRTVALAVCFLASTAGAYFLGRMHGSSSASREASELLALAKAGNRPADTGQPAAKSEQQEPAAKPAKQEPAPKSEKREPAPKSAKQELLPEVEKQEQPPQPKALDTPPDQPPPVKAPEPPVVKQPEPAPAGKGPADKTVVAKSAPASDKNAGTDPPAKPSPVPAEKTEEPVATGQAAGGPAGPAPITLTGKVKGTLYPVGEGKTYRKIGDVPWGRLRAGDEVRIHWKKEPYREKILISERGTKEFPIRVVGVPGPDGQLPVLDAENATTGKTIEFVYAGTQDRGLVIVSPSKGYRWGFIPGYIHIEGLELRNAAKPHKFTDNKGQTRSYKDNTAGIFIERGEHIVVRGCTITGCGNGFFVASGGTKELQSRDILMEGCYLHDNGNVGRDREHSIYTEAIGIVFQYNRLGRLRPGSGGNNIKDRSAGTVIRYNWIEGGAHLIDLCESQESWPLASKDPGYNKAFVYGNVLINGPGDGVNLIRYGGSEGGEKYYRKGTLYFYNNTLVLRCNQTGKDARWRTILFRLPTNDQAVDARNNIIYRSAATAGAPPTELSLLDLAGVASFGKNWVTPGWLPGRSGGKSVGKLTGTQSFLGDAKNNPGFVNLAAFDLHLAPGSPCLGAGGPLADLAKTEHPLTREYAPRQYGRLRSASDRPDLGAFAFRPVSSAGR